MSEGLVANITGSKQGNSYWKVLSFLQALQFVFNGLICSFLFENIKRFKKIATNVTRHEVSHNIKLPQNATERNKFLVLKGVQITPNACAVLVIYLILLPFRIIISVYETIIFHAYWLLYLLWNAHQLNHCIKELTTLTWKPVTLYHSTFLSPSAFSLIFLWWKVLWRPRKILLEWNLYGKQLMLPWEAEEINLVEVIPLRNTHYMCGVSWDIALLLYCFISFCV